MPSRTQLLEDLVQIASENQEDQARTTMVLDDKAQRASTISAVFLAAAFGFTKPDILKALVEHFGAPAILLFASTICLCLISIAFSLAETWVRRVPHQLSVFAQEPAARPLLSLGEETIGEEFHRLYLENRLEVWKWILETHLKVNHYKARALFVCTDGTFFGGVVC